MQLKVVLLSVCLLFLTAAGHADGVVVGQKATDWSFADANDNMFTMETWAGKVLLVNYVDPDESDINEHFNDAMKKAKDGGRLKEETYKGIGIADCAATWKPNFAIRAIAGDKAKKFKTVILFDYDAVLRNAWGLEKDTGNVILLDKDRVVRAIVRGRVPDEQVAQLVDLAVELQGK